MSGRQAITTGGDDGIRNRAGPPEDLCRATPPTHKHTHTQAEETQGKMEREQVNTRDTKSHWEGP